MASITKFGEKWRAQIKIRGNRASKVFCTEEDAKGWASQYEARALRRAELRELVEVGAGLPNFPERILQAMADAPLSRSEILGAAIPTSVICGIYFLIKRDRIVYVGQSKNVLRRIARHIDDGREFDRFTISPCKEEDLDRMEATYISALYPDQNVMLGKAA